MNGSELLSKIVKSINSYSGFNNEDVNNAIDIDGNMLDAISKLKALTPPPNIISFLSGIELLVNNAQTIEDSGGSSFLSEPYLIIGTPEFVNFSLPAFEKKNRSFAHANSDFVFFSTKILFDNGVLINLAYPTYLNLWNCIQEFCERCYSNSAAGTEPPLIIDFLYCIENGIITKGFLVNKNAIRFLPEKHYAFVYLDYLNNSNSISLSSNLIYSTPQLNNALTLDPTKIYEQYFDVYDVLNELNQCSDILNRFLKLYHTLEYLVYRVYLVDMVRRIGGNKIFVREFITASENMAKGEKESFVKNFQKIFLLESAQISGELRPYSNAAEILELNNKNIVKAFAHTDLGKVAALIYGLRCGIVHNKEGEFHLTIANAEDFEILIPLIRQLIKTFESLVVLKLKENDPNIHYANRELNLY